MQAAGQYGEVPQFVGSRVGASHGHMFNISHEMSLSPTTTTSAQGLAGGHGHSHGHGLSLSHPPHSQASQSHMPSQILSVPSQPSFLLSHQPSQSHHQQQQQQAQHGFNMSMGGTPPKTTSALLPSPVLAHTQLQSQGLQSAAQQLQADIKQHQQQAVHSHQPHSQQQTIEDHVQQRNQQQQQQQQQQPPPPAPTLHASALEPEITSLSQQALNAGGNKGGMTREESLDGDEQDDEGEKGSGGNRWPRQEALALLKIRSEMDAAFRDSSLKGPLWEEVSRKLAEMGYQRSGKKCKEKFENVHKYYKRTKDGKTGRQDGKSYRFFTQLEALYGKPGDTTTLLNHTHKSLNIINTTISNNNIPSSAGLLALSGDNINPGLNLITAANNHNNTNINDNNNNNNNGINSLASSPPPLNTTSAAAATNAHIARTLERVESVKHESENSGALHFFFESSDDEDNGDDDEDDDEFDEPAARRDSGATLPNSKKRKRKSMKKYLAFFEKVMKKVLDKQEHMQQKFLEALEKRDQDRMIREEAWKRQEMARLNREHDVRAAERALAASRDASLVVFLQKMTGQSITLPPSNNITLQSNNQHSTALVPADYMQSEYNADKDVYDPTSKRWPKPEVLALIKLRTSLDQRFHEPGSKAVLWEEISAGMTAQGFARTSKRCKEKWENINKYFKKAKESNKKRPENAKTCPYFHHLNALYKEGLLGGGSGGGGSSISSKHLMVTEKGEELSEDAMDQQGNTSTYNVGESGQAQEGDSRTLPAGGTEIERPAGLTRTLTNAGAMTMTSSAGLALRTSTTSIDAKMHMFMNTERTDKDAGMKKAIAIPSTDVVSPSTAIDLSMAAAANKGLPVSTSSLLFNLDQGMSSPKSLSSGPTKQQE